MPAESFSPCRHRKIKSLTPSIRLLRSDFFRGSLTCFGLPPCGSPCFGWLVRFTSPSLWRDVCRSDHWGLCEESGAPARLHLTFVLICKVSPCLYFSPQKTSHLAFHSKSNNAPSNAPNVMRLS